MSAPPPLLLFAIGLVVVVAGAELVLRSATRVARMLGVSPIVIGLTVVSVGTTLPELAVGITAAVEDKGALAVGNIAGTNILNILLILGLSALIRPLPIRLRSIRLDVPVMLCAAVALLAFSMDGVLAAPEGVALLLAAVVYVVLLVRGSRRESAAMQREFAEEYGAAAGAVPRGPAALARQGLPLVVGMALTVLGATWLVDGAAAIAAAHGVSDAVIGLTIVAIGTSTPELVTTLVATWKDDRDVAIGNLIGSCIYNVLVILGLTLVVAPDGVPVGRDVLWIDLPLAALVALVCLPVFRSGRGVSRAEGGLFVSAYLAYLGTVLVLRT